MPRRRPPNPLLAGFVAAALLAVACSGDDPTPPRGAATSSGGTASPSSSPSQAPALVPVDGFTRLNVLPAPVAQQVVQDNTQKEPRTARAEVLQVSKLGDVVRVVVAWDQPQDGQPAYAEAMRAVRRPLDYQYEIGLRLYDPQNATLAEPLRAADGSCLCSQNTGAVPSRDKQSLYWADFPAPASDTVTLLMGKAVQPMEDLPVVADAPALDLPAELVDWGKVAPPAQVGLGAGEPVVRQVRRAQRTFGGAEDAQVGADADISVPADVLFAFDSASLTPAARRILAKAAPQLVAAARGKTVQVVGHTDDQGSTAYNQRLSERRARAVAAVLAPALRRAGITLRTSGKGETQPLVPNLDRSGRPIPQNQQRNRRVSFVFPRARGGASVAIDVARPLPSMPVARRTTPSPEVTGSLASVLTQNNKARLDVTRAQRVGDDVWVRLEFTSLAGTAPWGVTSGILAKNPVGYNANMSTTALVDAGRKTVSPPLDAGGGICLCSEDLGSGSLFAAPLTLWAVFPAPPASTTKVTLRVLGVGQVVDVPLS